MKTIFNVNMKLKSLFDLKKKVVNGKSCESLNLLVKMKNFQILIMNFRGKTDRETANFCVDHLN